MAGRIGYAPSLMQAIYSAQRIQLNLLINGRLDMAGDEWKKESPMNGRDGQKKVPPSWRPASLPFWQQALLISLALLFLFVTSLAITNFTYQIFINSKTPAEDAHRSNALSLLRNKSNLNSGKIEFGRTLDPITQKENTKAQITD